jgi:hypothetical protein
MGYETDRPERWHAKREATQEQREQIGALTKRSAQWHQRAHRKLSSYCRRLGYSCSEIQSSYEWLAAFADELLKPKYWSERQSILQLDTMSSRRSDRILAMLYLFAQHGRLQFKPSSVEHRDPKDGSPFEELRANQHNLDHLLLRMICHLCGYRDTQRMTPNGLVARFVRNMTSWYLGPADNDITPNRVARWASVAGCAAGIAPRDPECLRKTWRQTEASPSKRLYQRALLHFRAAWNAKAPSTT